MRWFDLPTRPLLVLAAAGAELLEKMLSAEGGALAFDVRASKMDQPSADQPLVILDGPNGLRLVTGFDPVAVGWNSYRIPLSTAGNWFNEAEDRRATSSDIRTVLTDLVDLRIRLGFGDTTLDNVRMIAGPTRRPQLADSFLASDDFDDARGGWTGLVDDDPVTGNPPTWDTTGGRQDGGLIRGYWRNVRENHFVAPAAYLGNQSVAFGGAIEFDVFSETDHQDGREPLIVLVGANGVRLGASLEAQRPGWLRYRASLDERGGWIDLDADATATDGEIRGVLQDLAGLHIRAIKGATNYPATLDNVRLVRP